MSAESGRLCDSPADDWLERHARLQRELAAEPDGEWAWLWRVRLDVLDFLLARRGEEPPPAPDHAWRPIGEGLPETVAPYAQRRAATAADVLGADGADALRDRLRTKLQTLSALNRDTQENLAKTFVEEQRREKVRRLWESGDWTNPKIRLFLRDRWLPSTPPSLDTHLLAMRRKNRQPPAPVPPQTATITEDEAGDILLGRTQA